MQRKLLIALQLKVEHRFIEGFASERARGVEDPGAFRATPTSKTLLFNPYQLPTHGCPCRRAHRSTVTQSRHGGGCANKLEKLTRVNSDGLFGILRTHQGLFAPHTRFPGLLLHNGEANVGYPTEASCLREPVYFSGSSANKQRYCFSDLGWFTPVILISSRIDCGKQRPPSRTVWRADEYRWKTSWQQNTSFDLRYRLQISSRSSRIRQLAKPPGPSRGGWKAGICVFSQPRFDFSCSCNERWKNRRSGHSWE